jgi:hypothetical protein
MSYPSSNQKSQVTIKGNSAFGLRQFAFPQPFPKDGLLICLVITEKFYSDLFYSEILSRMRSAEQEMCQNGT